MRLIDGEKLIEYCNNQKVKTIDANDIARFPTVDAIPIEPLAVWLAGYRTSPPEYALIQAGAYNEIDPASVAYTASQSAKAWAYHLRKLMESGLMG